MNKSLILGEGEGVLIKLCFFPNLLNQLFLMQNLPGTANIC